MLDSNGVDENSSNRNRSFKCSQLKYQRSVILLRPSDPLIIMHKLKAPINISRLPTLLHSKTNRSTAHIQQWLTAKMMFLRVLNPKQQLGPKSTAYVHEGQVCKSWIVRELRSKARACLRQRRFHKFGSGLDSITSWVGRTKGQAAGGPSIPSSATAPAILQCPGLDCNVVWEGQGLSCT